MAYSENVKKFMDEYMASPEMQAEYAAAEAEYPGSLEIRESVAEYVLLPFARQRGYDFTVDDLRKYETFLKVSSAKDVEIDPDEPESESVFFLLDHGWTDDVEKFKKK